MKNPILIYFFLFGSLLLFSCNKKNKAVLMPSSSFDIDDGNLSKGEPKSTTKIPKKPYVVASLQKNGCFGKCPEFEFIVLSNGIANYHGKKHTAMIGDFQSTVPKGFSMELENKVKETNYFVLEQMYPTNRKTLKDLPDTYTLVNINGQKLIIRNNHDAPASLLEFEKYLETWIEKLKWERKKDHR